MSVPTQHIDDSTDVNGNGHEAQRDNQSETYMASLQPQPQQLEMGKPDSEKEKEPRPLHGRVALIVDRLLALPLFYKVLIANSAIVLIGALAGTAITWHVASTHLPEALDVSLAAVFAIIGLSLTAALNALVLRAAFSPLARLQDVARRVQEGDLSVRAEATSLADKEIDQLASTLNQILDEVQSYEEQMRALSGSVIRAQEEERQRIARELHDDTGQVLTLLLIRLKLLESQSESEETRQQIEELRGLVSSAIDQVRRLALNLRPPTIDQLGLIPALRSLVATYTTNTHINVKLDAPREAIRLSPEHMIAVYRIAQEALTNVAKHSGARSVMMNVSVHDDTLHLDIRDDGHGFDMSAVAHRRQRPPMESGPGVGLFGMEERARLAGGALHIQSAPGRGTFLGLTVPLEEEPQPITEHEPEHEAYAGQPGKQ